MGSLVLSGISSAASLAGGIVGMQGANTAAGAATTMANYENRQGRVLAQWQANELRKQGREAQSAAGLAMRERYRDEQYAASTLQARAAAGGQGSSPTVMGLFKDLAERTAFLASTDNAAGLREARSYNRQAAATIFQQKINSRANTLQAQATSSAYKSQGQASLISGIGGAASALSSGYSNYKAYH